AGTLLADGTAQPILFTSYADDTGGITRDHPFTPAAPGDWGGIAITPGGSATLNHVDVRYGGNAGGDVTVNGGALRLTNSLIHNSSGIGLRIDHSNPTVTGDTFR